MTTTISLILLPETFLFQDASDYDCGSVPYPGANQDFAEGGLDPKLRTFCLKKILLLTLYQATSRCGF